VIVMLTAGVEASIVSDLRLLRARYEEILTWATDRFDIELHENSIAAIDAVIGQLHLRPPNERLFVQLCACCRKPLPTIPVPTEGDAWDVCEECLSLRPQCRHRQFGYDDPFFDNRNVRCCLCGLVYDPSRVLGNRDRHDASEGARGAPARLVGRIKPRSDGFTSDRRRGTSS
jgi:hypothetical protein